ncbi:alcohol dehydrogenase catalytic domain-containing protein [Metasolibacillus sp. FSL H7-0170]|uniref:zinc-dependent alcohol dehydrogenase n=1 Tax=Metasolibacillus sp. FSL H7-0170 TaxID=2921431 RepID=UPI000AE1BEC8
MKMKQALMTKPATIVFQEVDVPTVGENQVKLAIKKIGVCGSDIHVYHGEHPYTQFPVVQGHEIAAEVIEIGANVSSVQVGTKVTVQPQVVCGKCFPCQNGMYHVCEELKVMGFQTTGLASEYFVVDADKLTVLPTNLSFDEGAMVEPLAVAVHAVERVPHIENKNVLVIGGGPIGNLVAQTAKAFGANKVVVSELSEARLEFAKKVGLEVIDSKSEDLQEGIIRHFGMQKADVIFECVGSSFTVANSINIARKGSTVVIVGVVSNLTEVNMGYVQDHELQILGTAMYQSQDFDKAVDLLTNKEVEVELLITNHVKFEDYLEAYHIIEENKDKVMKVIIDMN